MNTEMEAIQRNDTWELFDLPKDKQPIGVKWIYKVKQHADGSIDWHQTRLVAKGFSQKLGEYYSKDFSPLARFDTIKTVLEIATQNTWPVFQMHVKYAILNGHIDKEVYLE